MYSLIIINILYTVGVNSEHFTPLTRPVLHHIKLRRGVVNFFKRSDRQGTDGDRELNNFQDSAVKHSVSLYLLTTRSWLGTAGAPRLSVLLPDPDVPLVTVGGTAVPHSALLRPHRAPLALATRAARPHRVAGGGGGGAGGRGVRRPLAGSPTSTGDCKERVLVPVIDLAVSPPVEAPGILQVTGTHGVPPVDEAAHVDQRVVPHVPDPQPLQVVEELRG